MALTRTTAKTLPGVKIVDCRTAHPGRQHSKTRPWYGMIILGLNAFHGDSSAALVRDGVLLAAAEEESDDDGLH